MAMAPDAVRALPASPCGRGGRFAPGQGAGGARSARRTAPGSGIPRLRSVALGMTRRGAAAPGMTGRGPPRAPGYCMAANAEATLDGIALPLVGQAAVRRAPAQGAPKSFACARPLHRRRDRRRAPPFPDSSPPTGERIKERGTHRASGVEGRGGTHPEARGGASSPPPHPSLSPQGGRETRTNTARGNDGSGASGSCLSPPRSLLPVTLSEAKGLREAICPPAAWRTHLPAPTRQAGRCA